MNTIDANLTTPGDSVVVRLPKELLRISGLGKRVRLEAKQGKIIISRIEESRESWVGQIKALAQKKSESEEFTNMNITAQDGLEELPWESPSFEEWIKQAKITDEKFESNGES